MIMKLLLPTLLILFVSLNAQAQKYNKVKIYGTNAEIAELAQHGFAVDHGTRKWNTFFVSDFADYEILKLEQLGYSYEILIDDVKDYYAKRSKQSSGEAKNLTCDNGAGGSGFTPQTPQGHFENNSYAGFYKYQDMLDALDDMAMQYPNLITVKAPISTFLTHEGRPVYYVKISDSPATDDASEPKVLYTAIHHAREPLSMSQTIYYMWYLLENYATNEEVQFLVDNTEMYFVPCINPDGYIENEANDPTGFGMHRKNKAPVGSSNPGVDLNRNYSYGWNTTGVSSDPNNDTYPGSGPFSEPETQAIQWLVENVGFVSAFNAHTYGETLLYPIGTTTNEFADHHDYFADLSGHMCEFNGYFPQKSSGLYPASGDSDDYMYKVDIGVGAKDTIFAMTPEIGTDFWPAQGEIEPTCAGMVHPNMVLSHIAHRYLVVKDEDPGIIADMSGNFNHSALRLGRVDGSVQVSITPLLNIQSVGAAVSHDLEIRESANGAISYDLSPGIQFGDEIRYVLNTDYGVWVDRDTISKTFGALTLQFSDDAMNASNWSGSWTTTTDEAYSPSQSFTESDGGNYQNDADEIYEFNQAIDLTNATQAMITFYAKWEIEADYDYCQFQVSTDGGNNWEGQCGKYTVEGTSTFWNGSAQPDGEPVWEGTSDWVMEEISLSDYIGQVINVRFRFESDGGVRQDGFYFDDFQVAFNEDVSGIEELSVELNVVPNPANDRVVISSSEVLYDPVIKIYDELGRQVKQIELKGAYKNCDIDLNDLGSGYYNVQLSTKEKEIRSVKMIIAR